MANATVTVDITGVNKFNVFTRSVADLIKQIEINDYKDNLGNELKMNKAYINIVDGIKSL